MDDLGEHPRSGPLPRPGFLDVTLSILVAFNFAVAQPILDLTGRFPQFFLARRSPRADLFLLAIGLAIAVPLVVALIVWLGGLVSRRLGTALHVLAVAGLTATLALQLIDEIPGLRSAAAPLFVSVAGAIGIAVVAVYYRVAGVRRFVRLTAIVALLLPALFLFSSPASKLVLRQSAAISGSTVIRNPVPVVMLLLDEFPIASIMNAEHGIDTAMFPGFARLAAGSTWYRNATAVHDFTEVAVPSILTGNYGDKRKLPVASSYPDNIFTLLGGAYDVRAFEAFTQLCPVSICRTPAKPVPGFTERWKGLVSDLRIIYEHVVAPPTFVDDLPSIDQTWSNFGGGAGKPASADAGAKPDGELSEEPLGDLTRFIASIEPATRPTFWFAHIELPHAPWRYLPSGQEYVQRPPIPGRTKQVWGSDDWLLAQAYQRHLLQVAAVDRQVDALIDRLKRTGIYDRALILVSADHGISFRANSDLRVAQKETIGDIGAVPMFVKLPQQTAARVDDRPVETFDMVPTIADVLDVQGMYSTEGRSILGDGPLRTKKILRSTHGHVVEFGVGGKEKDAIVDRKLELFGTAGGLERLYAITPGGVYGDLLDTSPSVPQRFTGTVAVDSASSYRRFDPAADVIRTLVAGTVTGVPGQRVLAISVGGRIVAVTRTFVRGGRMRFHAMVPPEALRKGQNDLDVFLVEGARGDLVLSRLRAA